MSLLQRPIVAVLAFAVIYAAVSLSITNSYYQLIMTLVLVWAIFGLYSGVMGAEAAAVQALFGPEVNVVGAVEKSRG